MRQATPSRGATLLVSVFMQRGGKRAVKRTGLPGQHRYRGREVRRHVQVDEVAVRFDERPDQLVADAEIERQLRALPPVVLDEEARLATAQRDVARAVLHRRLLRQAEQEIGEVGSAVACGRQSAGRVEPREDEGAVGVGIGIAAGAIDADVAAGAELVRLVGMRPRRRERDPPIGPARRRHVANARQPENESAGTPQSNGSVETPVMPALPATSMTRRTDSSSLRRSATS